MSYSKVYANAYCNGEISEIENFEEASSSNEMYELHHRLETHDLNGNKLKKQRTRRQLDEAGLLYHRPPKELIFLQKSVHRALHLRGNANAKGKNLGNTYALGNKLSEETKKKMGKSRLGNTSNGLALIKCLETGEVHRTNEWAKIGYRNAYQVASGRQKSCHGKTFIYIKATLSKENYGNTK